MKTLTDFLNEKRRNPEQNPKISSYEALKKYKGRKDIYISFTSINKIGINPHNKFGTPTAIYTYPLDAVWKMIERDKGVKGLPFAFDRKYIQVLQSSGAGMIQDISKSYTKSDYNRDMDKLRKLYPYDKKDQAQDNVEYSIYFGSKDARDQSWGGKFWNVTRWVANNHKNPDQLRKAGTVHKWNGVFRKLGYAGVADRSASGIIHENEPLQAIFFSTKGFKHVETIMNIQPKTKEELAFIV